MRSSRSEKLTALRRTRERPAALVGWAALLAVTVALSAACAGHQNASQDEKRELVWAIGDPGTKHDPTVDIVGRWNAKHPSGPTVRVVKLGESADDQRQQMATELTAGLPHFDLLTLDVTLTGEFAAEGWLADLESKASQIKGASSPVPLRSAIWDGRLWAAPFTTNVGLLYYRTDLVPPDFASNPPKKWDVIRSMGADAVQKAGDPDLAPFVGQGGQYEGLVVNYLEYMWSAGGDIFNLAGTEVAFAEKPALDALKFMKTSRSDGFFAPGFETMNEGKALDRFRSGKAVFMRSWTPDYDSLKAPGQGNEVSDRFGVVPLPSLNGDATTPAIGGQNLAVSRFSKNTKGAKEFATFASTDRDVQMKLARTSWAPTMASIYDDPAVADNPLMKIVGQVLPHAKPRPSTPLWTTISAEIQQNVYPAYAGEQITPEDAVKSIRTFLARALSSA